MVGLSHLGLRQIHAELGGTGLFFTEMLAAKRLPHDNPSCSPLLIRAEDEYPLFYQLVVGDPQYLGPALLKIEKLGAHGIDLNLGCPAPFQIRQGAGLALAGDLGKTALILSTIKKHSNLPISAKIRLGKEIDREQLASFCLMLEDHGVDLITVHARLNGEKFCRKPRWQEISYAKKAVSVPIFANGGIFTVEDARQCLKKSGADGLMLGRGAVTRPWLSREIATEVFGHQPSPSTMDRRKLFFLFVKILEENFPCERRLGRIKQFTSYFANSFSFGHQLFRGVQASSSVAEAKDAAAAFFATTNTYPIH